MRFILLLLLFIVLLPHCFAETTTIPIGGDVFIGEEGLNIKEAVPSPYDSIAYFPPGSSPGNHVPLEVRHIGDSAFSVNPALFLDRTGSWYQWDSKTGAPGSIAFNVREPRVTLRILRFDTQEDLSSGNVPRGIPLTIQVDTNTGTISQRPGFNPETDSIMDLLITTPNGGTLSGIETKNSGTFSLSKLTPQGSLPSFPSVSTGGWDTGAKSGGGTTYSAGTYTVKPKLTFNRIDDNLKNADRPFIINRASVTIGSTNTKISSSSDMVTRGNSFTITISGNSGVPVYLWINAPNKSGNPGDQPPMFLFAQDGVKQDNPEGPFSIGSYAPSSGSGKRILDLVPKEPYNGVKYYAEVIPDKNGVRIVELRTSDQTSESKYSIKIESESAAGGQKNSDEVSVSVVKGSMQITASQFQYTIGEEVKLSGVNTESCDTYLFITGPNLPPGGGKLTNPKMEVRTGDPTTFTKASGNCETWDYTLYTGDLGVDAGTYTIFAVPSPVNRNNLNSVPYQTIPLTLQKPTVSVRPQENEVAKGDSLIISGKSTGASGKKVAIWIFGKNYFLYDEESVERDGTFGYKLSEQQTRKMESGQYVVIIQHPMSNGQYGVWPDAKRELVVGRYPTEGAPIFRISGPGALKGPDAANALISALESPNIGDQYSRWDIRVTNPRIGIDPASSQQVAGKPMVISGTTNLGVGKRLLLEITDNSFAPTKKNDRNNFQGYSASTVIFEDSNKTQTFSFSIPSDRLSPGEYRMSVQGVETEVMTSGLLSVTMKDIAHGNIPPS
jgi:trimeric autotransporter adhesin